MGVILPPSPGAFAIGAGIGHFSDVSPDRRPHLVHCSSCGHEWAFGFGDLSLEVAAKAMSHPCLACGRKSVFLGLKPKPTAPGDVLGWRYNGDTGRSSLTIWHTLWAVPIPPGLRLGGPPADVSDFGRCYRLLNVVPSWRDRLGEVADRFPAWRPLVDAWNEVTALYEEELGQDAAPKTYARLKDLLK